GTRRQASTAASSSICLAHAGGDQSEGQQGVGRHEDGGDQRVDHAGDGKPHGQQVVQHGENEDDPLGAPADVVDLKQGPNPADAPAQVVEVRLLFEDAAVDDRG